MCIGYFCKKEANNDESFNGPLHGIQSTQIILGGDDGYLYMMEDYEVSRGNVSMVNVVIEKLT